MDPSGKDFLKSEHHILEAEMLDVYFLLLDLILGLSAHEAEVCLMFVGFG